MDKIIQTTILMGLLIIHLIQSSLSHRLTSSDSILDIINTENVQRLLAERRQNSSRNDRRFLIENDLDEDYPEPDNHQGDIYQTPDIGYQVNHRRNNNNNNNRNQRRPMDILMKYNHTAYSHSSHPDILQDLQSFRAEKMLKSSKNALIVTKKEYLKKDWCKTEPLVQRIREDGCLSKTIINRFCYGQCNSFYIPKSPKRKRNENNKNNNHNNHNNNNNNSRHNRNQNHHHHNSNSDTFEDEDLTEAAFRSCAFCKPKKITWITVTLRCPSLMPQLRKKRIQRIKQCKCIAEPLN